MSKIFVSGLTNIETSLNVNSFPIEYSPIEYPFFGVSSSVSGVGYNISKALKVLKDDVSLFTIVGEDNSGEIVLSTLNKDKIDTIIQKVQKTAESVVLVDKEGKRKIYCDLKNLQEIHSFDISINPKDYDLAVLTNINFSRSLIRLFKDSGVTTASDVHVLRNIDDEYNKEFLENSDILFLSNEGCLGNEAEFIKSIQQTYHNKIIVIGCGEEGALAFDGKEYYYEKAVAPLGIKNTVGAGDALFSSFIHYFLKTKDIQKSLKFAATFAGIKISSSGGAEGFAKEDEVLKYINR